MVTHDTENPVRLKSDVNSIRQPHLSSLALVNLHGYVERIYAAALFQV